MFSVEIHDTVGTNMQVKQGTGSPEKFPSLNRDEKVQGLTGGQILLSKPHLATFESEVFHLDSTV